MMEVFSDPIIFCHDDYAWLEAVKAWADNSEEKLERLLPAIPSLHLLSAKEKDKIYKDQSFSKTVKSHIEKVNEDTEVTRSVVQYIPIDMFSLNEELGWQEEECEENFRKNCFIEYEQIAFNETAEICRTPLVKDCDVQRPEICRTEHESEC